MTVSARGLVVLRVLALIGAIAAGVALSIQQGIHQHVGQDFHVFWQAGRNFATGDPLYHGYLPGARQFKYPPFAAFLFQILALVPLRIAAILFSLLNLILWVVAIRLGRTIVTRTFPTGTQSVLQLVLAVALSAQFFLDNFHHVQVNGLIFVLVLLGIEAYLREKDLPAAGYLVTATAIKITPIFFVGWLLIRGRRRAALAVVPLAIGCILVPLLLRGPATGWGEIVEYYRSFLEGHQHGRIAQYSAGHNLAALINRMTLAPEPGRPSYAYLHLSQPTAQRIYLIMWSGVFLALLLTLVLLRLRRVPVSAFELSLVFLAGLLLSPITFTTHMVSLLFVFLVFLSLRPSGLGTGGKLIAILLVAGMILTGLSGRDVVGPTAYLEVRGYGVFVWTMLGLFLTAMVLSMRARPGGADATFLRSPGRGVRAAGAWLALLAIAPATLAGQADSTSAAVREVVDGLGPSARVRVESEGNRWTGRLTARHTDSLALSGETGTRTVRLAAIDTLWVRSQKHDGLLAGAAFGAVMFGLLHLGDNSEDPGLSTHLGAVIFGGSVLAGLLLDGASQRWTRRYPR